MSKTSKHAPAVRVYSYLRFSRPEQSLGDSERRQLDDAKAYAKRNGLELDESLRMTDRGLSGYHGAHRKKGALGQFLANVESGEVPRGSILLVENIDRLGRENFFQAFETVSRIVSAGITIQTLSPEDDYTCESINGGKIYQLVGQIQRAHEESGRKSRLIKAARERERIEARNGKTVSRMRPAWIAIDDDGRRTAIPQAAKAIAQIFDWKLKGFGVPTIERKLNAEAPWSPPRVTKEDSNRHRGGNGWRASYIKKILRNRAVIGEHQLHEVRGGRNGKRVPLGEPINNYFPVIVKPEVFHAVQQMLEANRGKGGRTGKAWNLFKHLVKCAYCSGSMVLVDKGKPPKGSRYLVCEIGRRGAGCAYHSIRYDECETVLLENCHRLKPAQVLPNPNEQAKRCRALRDRVAGLDSEQRDVEQRLNNLLDQIERAPSGAVRDRYQKRMVELEQHRQELAAQEDETQKALDVAERGSKSFTRWQRDLESLKGALSKDDPELRMRLQSHLREFIERIEVYSDGHKAEYNDETDDGESLALELEAGFEWANPRAKLTIKHREFLRYLTGRRMTREGRFLRVHFKTGAIVNLVPAGSIASGLELKRGKKDWGFVSPNVERLWEQFVAPKRPLKSKLTGVGLFPNR